MNPLFDVSLLAGGSTTRVLDMMAPPSEGAALVQIPDAMLAQPAVMRVLSPSNSSIVPSDPKPKDEAKARADSAMTRQRVAYRDLEAAKTAIKNVKSDDNIADLQARFRAIETEFALAKIEHSYWHQVTHILRNTDPKVKRDEEWPMILAAKLDALAMHPDALLAEYDRILRLDLDGRLPGDTKTLLRGNADESKALRRYITQDPVMVVFTERLKSAMLSELQDREHKRKYPALAFAAGASAVADVLGVIPERMIVCTRALIRLGVFESAEEAARFMVVASFTMGSVSADTTNYLAQHAKYGVQSKRNEFERVRRAVGTGYCQAFSTDSETSRSKCEQFVDASKMLDADKQGLKPKLLEHAARDAKDSLDRARTVVDDFVKRLAIAAS